jgi:hypothetical protein
MKKEPGKQEEAKSNGVVDCPSREGGRKKRTMRRRYLETRCFYCGFCSNLSRVFKPSLGGHGRGTEKEI